MSDILLFHIQQSSEQGTLSVEGLFPVWFQSRQHGWLTNMKE